MIKLFIVDDHPMVIEGIKTLLQDSSIITIIGSATDAFQALDALKKEKAEVILVDINLPDLNGIELCEQLKKQFPGIFVLGLSTFKERSYITRMIAQGASGYLLKNASKEELEEAITTAYRGGMYLSMEVTQILTKATANAASSIPLLTLREKEVLHLIAEGYTNNQIAAQLFISPLTVDSHRKNLLAKFSARNTAALVRLAVEYKLLD
ncbi:MAG: response regulator transcription factor [Saprospiraceae bacterium]